MGEEGLSKKLQCRREICQHNHTTRFSGPKILHTKTRKFLLFLLVANNHDVRMYTARPKYIQEIPSVNYFS